MRTRFIFPLFFLFLFGLVRVSAWGPNTHLYIFEEGLARENTTLIAQIIQNNYGDCLSGLIYPDSGIFEYYTNFKAYKGLHDYNAVDEMLRIAPSDGFRAFTYCYKSHLAPDGISHNLFIPDAIRSTKLPNYVIHPIQELKIEGRYLDPRANRLMENHKKFDSFVAQATGRDWSDEAERLNVILGGGVFYSQAFNPESTTTFGKVQRGFFKLVESFVSEETGRDYIELSIEETRAILRGETPQLDPSGEAALRAADKESALWLYSITFLIIVIVFVFSIKKGWIWPGRR